MEMDSSVQFCRHSFTNTSHICLAQDCDERFLCERCSIQHNRFHSVSITPFLSILENNPKTQIDSLVELLNDFESRKQAVYTHYFNALDKIREEINNRILEIRAHIEKDFQANSLKQTKLPNLAVVAKELAAFNTKCLQNPRVCLQNNKKTVIEGHILKYIQFQQDIEKINDAADFSSIKSLSYKGLQKQIDILLHATNETLKNFTKTYFEGGDSKKNYSFISSHQNNKELAKPIQPTNIIQSATFEIPKENIPPPQNFDIRKLHKEFTLKLPANPSWNSIEYIPDHNLTVIGDELGNLEFWAAITWECLFVERHHLEKINTVKYSKKFNSIITASNDSTIKVFHTRNPPSIDNITLLTEHKDKVWSLLVLENHNSFYSSGKEPCIIGWDLNTLQVKHKIDTRGRDTTGTEMTFIERLKLLVVSFKEGTISFYNIETPSEIRSINVYQKWLHCLKYIEERDQLIVGVDVGTLKVWKIGNYDFQPVKGYKIPGKLPLSLTSLSKGKEILVATEYSKLVLLNLETGDSLKSHNFEFQGVKAFKYIPQTQNILVVSGEAEISVLKY